MIVPGKLSALIVDDNAYARTAATATLRKLGLSSIDEVDGAAAAVGAILGRRYDVVLMDWYMPEMNGAALLQIMRDERFGPNGTAPVIVVTAYPNREVMVRARQLGASEILTKPFTPAQVGGALGRLVPHGWDLPPELAADEDPETQHFL